MKLVGIAQLVALAVLVTCTTGYRLSGSVVPSMYQVHLTIPQTTFTAASDRYDGYVIITCTTTQENTTQIQFNAAHDFITISQVFIGSSEITSISVDNNTDIVTLSNFTLFQNFNYVVYITFTSRLSTQDMYGFYKSSYEVNGQTRYLATTQFQSHYARRAFPCFDEPAFKAVFEIYLSYPPTVNGNSLNALSNMPGELYNASDIVESDPSLITTKFSTTGIMPTYLVAFIISDFTFSDGGNIEGNEVPYKVWSSAPTNLTRGLALDAGVTLMQSLNRFTNYSYGSLGFPKMDQVAIPDFAAGAMENWGLVTYRERLLLWDEVDSTNMDMQNIATVISHEYAHQWWGNLVTMQWWSETFLNEGFATYFEYFTTHDVYPDWELDKQWVVRVLQRILETDSLTSSPALQRDANTGVEIMSMFHSTSYLKGGSIFRMAEHILGTDNFVQGLRNYLREYAFKNTIPINLWDSLDATLQGTNRSRLPSDKTLGEVMQNWVETPGYPILNLRRVDTAVIVRQEGRFLLNGNDTEKKWYIPITYTTNFNPDFESTAPQDWLETIGYVEIPFIRNNVRGTWLVLNPQVTGYYRVNYNELWDPLIVALSEENFSNIPEVNRASFVDDAFHLARADYINYTRAFNIIDFLRTDTSYYPWFPAISGFNFLLRRVGQDSRLGRAMSNHTLDLLTNVYASVPWTNLNRTDHPYTLKQVDVLSLACRLNLSNCVNHALERFGEYRISGIRPTQNLRSIVYCNALRYGGSADDWALLWNAYLTTNVASEQVRILSALGCIQDEAILEHYLHLTLDPTSGIRSQDAISVFASVYSGSTMGIAIAFKFLKENHTAIEERYQSMNALSNMIAGLAERFTTEAELTELRNFIETGELHAEFHSAASLALATAESNLNWLNQNWEELHNYYGLDPEEDDDNDDEENQPPTSVPTTPPNDEEEDDDEETQPPTSVPTTPPKDDTDGAATFAASAMLLILPVILTLKN